MEESGIWDSARKSTAIMFRQEREGGTIPGHNGLVAKGNPFPSVLDPFPPVTSLCLSAQNCPSLSLAAITPYCTSLGFYWLCCFSCMNVSYEHFACICLVYSLMPRACPLVGSRVILRGCGWGWIEGTQKFKRRSMSKSNPSGKVSISAGVLGRSNSGSGGTTFPLTAGKGCAIPSLRARVPSLWNNSGVLGFSLLERSSFRYDTQGMFY